MNTQLTGLQRRLSAAVALACTLTAVTTPVLAEPGWGSHMHGMGAEGRFHEDRLAPEHDFGMHREAPAFRNEPGRFEPGRFGTPRGTLVGSLPRESVFIQHGGISYRYHNGVWYRPYGASFLVVGAPIGAFVPLLPPFYTTVWFGGLPYYYADDVYYTWHPEQSSYQVVAPPPGAPEPVVNGDRLYAYPLNGQTADQQSRDRYDCHVWATHETGVDPSQNAKGMTATQTTDYDRATTACLSGRGYSVK